MRRVLFLLIALPLAAQQNLPAALSSVLDQWKSAVTVGDSATIFGMYSANPRGYVVSSDGKQQLPINDETNFWSKTRTSGMQNVELTVRSVQQQQGAELLNLLLSFRAHTPRGLRTRYVIEQQAWIQQLGAWRMIASTHSDVLKIRPPDKLNAHLYPEPSAANAELQDALRKANTAGKRVLVIFGGNWCYDCHVLDAAMHEPELLPVVDNNFVVVHINIGEDGKQNNGLATKYGILLEKGVPAIAVLARDGRLLYSDKHGEFEKARSMDPDDVAAFLNRWKPAK